MDVNVLSDLFVTTHYNMMRSLLCLRSPTAMAGSTVFSGCLSFPFVMKLISHEHCGGNACFVHMFTWTQAGTEYILGAEVKDEGHCDLLNKSVVITQEFKSLQNCVLLIG